MSHLSIDLDDITRARAVAGAAGITDDEVLGGMLRIRAWCFAESIYLVNPIHVKGHYGPINGIEIVLETFGLLIKTETEGIWEVRGAREAAEARIAKREARKRGGISATNNLRQNKPKKVVQPVKTPKIMTSPPANDRLTTGSAPAEPSANDRLLHLTSNIKHLTSNIDLKATSAVANAATEIKKPGWQNLVSRLDSIFLKARNEKFLWLEEDFSALKALRKTFEDNEICERWELALTAVGFKQVSKISQLRSKWNEQSSGKKPSLMGTGEIRATEGGLF